MKSNKTIDSIIEMIKQQTGVIIENCENFPGIFFNGGRYFNALLKDRVSESKDYTILSRFCIKYDVGIKVEPNGLNRISIFF